MLGKVTRFLSPFHNLQPNVDGDKECMAQAYSLRNLQLKKYSIAMYAEGDSCMGGFPTPVRNPRKRLARLEQTVRETEEAVPIKIFSSPCIYISI